MPPSDYPIISFRLSAAAPGATLAHDFVTSANACDPHGSAPFLTITFHTIPATPSSTTKFATPCVLATSPPSSVPCAATTGRSS